MIVELSQLDVVRSGIMFIQVGMLLHMKGLGLLWRRRHVVPENFEALSILERSNPS